MMRCTINNGGVIKIRVISNNSLLFLLYQDILGNELHKNKYAKEQIIYF